MTLPAIPRQPSRRDLCRVVLVDRRPVVRAALSMALPRHDFDVVATWDRLPDELPFNGKQHVVLLADGLTPSTRRALPRLKGSGDVAVVLATAVTREAAQLLDAGLVDGVLGPDAGIERLARALRRAGAGERFLIGMERPAPVQTRPPVDLTEREEQVLTLLAAGLSNHAIAKDLTISVNTVRSHVHTLLHKLGVGHRVAAVRRASDLGLLDRVVT